ncbi:MAG: hypothetical protein CL596_05275 [Alteromonas sp.]|nr:hypothetical protein [Alteromonas sp.]
MRKYKITLDSGSIFIKYKEYKNNKRVVYYIPELIKARDLYKLTPRLNNIIHGSNFWPMTRKEFGDFRKHVKAKTLYITQV